MGVTIMIDHYQNTILTQQRQAELHREAESARAASEAAQTAHDGKPFYAPLLNTVGQGLIQLGSGLQERYGEAAELQPQPQGKFAPAHK
jgi:hypothetical protein